MTAQTAADEARALLAAKDEALANIGRAYRTGGDESVFTNEAVGLSEEMELNAERLLRGLLAENEAMRAVVAAADNLKWLEDNLPATEPAATDAWEAAYDALYHASKLAKAQALQPTDGGEAG